MVGRCRIRPNDRATAWRRATSRAWLANFVDLTRDHRVIAIDLPGFGDSAKMSAMPVLGVDASLLRLARMARLVHFARHTGHLRLLRFFRAGAVSAAGMGSRGQVIDQASTGTVSELTFLASQISRQTSAR